MINSTLTLNNFLRLRDPNLFDSEYLDVENSCIRIKVDPTPPGGCQSWPVRVKFRLFCLFMCLLACCVVKIQKYNLYHYAQEGADLISEKLFSWSGRTKNKKNIHAPFLTQISFRRRVQTLRYILKISVRTTLYFWIRQYPYKSNIFRVMIYTSWEFPVIISCDNFLW